MYRFRRRYINNQSGYTLLEALLHLMLFIIFSQLIFLIITAYLRFTNIENARIETDWEVCVYDMNDYLSMGGEVSVSEEGNSIKIVKDDRTVIIRFFKNVLWRNEKGGNETILTGVKEVIFTLHQHELKIIAKLQNDTVKERIFIVEEAME